MTPLHVQDYDPKNPWQPRRTCPRCGSTHIKIGCQFQDCEKCEDVEQSECVECGIGFGGASYWEMPKTQQNLRL